MLKQEKAVLVVVDVQGKLATLMYDKDNFYDNVVRMIKGAQVLELPIIWNEQLPDKLGETVEPVKQALAGQKLFVKKSFSCCGNPEFMKALEATGRRQVILVGMESHVCVYQTARDLLNGGYEVYLAVDAVSSRSPENKETGIRSMTALGAKLTCVEMALFEMLVIAEGDRFKQCIKIVK